MSIFKLFLALAIYSTTMTTVASTACTDYFKPSYLRYGVYYTFLNKVSNSNDYPIYLLEIQSEFSTLEYLEGGGKLDKPVQWDVPARTEGVVYTKSEFPSKIIKRPLLRATNMVRGDFLVKYIVSWGLSDKLKVATKVDCQPKIITWCGDGVIDTDLDYSGKPYETCDDGEKNGRTGQCSNRCTQE